MIIACTRNKSITFFYNIIRRCRVIKCPVFDKSSNNMFTITCKNINIIVIAKIINIYENIFCSFWDNSETNNTRIILLSYPLL